MLLLSWAACNGLDDLEGVLQPKWFNDCMENRS